MTDPDYRDLVADPNHPDWADKFLKLSADDFVYVGHHYAEPLPEPDNIIENKP